MWENNKWVPLGAGFPGNFASTPTVYSLAIDSDGNLLAGGQFGVAGSVAAKNIARWNGTEWSAFGSGLGPWNDHYVKALAVLADGRIVAGGYFAETTSQITNIAVWEGGKWNKLGAGLNAQVNALVATSDAKIIAAGGFSASGVLAMKAIAQWNGQAWEAMAGGLTSNGSSGGRGECLLRLSNGDVLVGGDFNFAGSGSAINIARWNGLQWTGMNSELLGQFEQGAFAVGVLPSGDIVASLDGSSDRVARCTNGTWSFVGGVFSNGSLRMLVVSPTGQLIVGGSHSRAGPHVTFGVSAWDGARWTALGKGFGPGISETRISSIVSGQNGNVVVGGDFSLSDAGATQSLAQWNGIDWLPVGGSVQGKVRALALLPDGAIVAGGYFSSIGGRSFLNIAQWDGQSWSSLGSGLPEGVESIVVTADGDVVASGLFSQVDGSSMNRIARWNGVKWNPLGTGLQSHASSLALDMNGNVIAAGNFETAGSVTVNRVAKWDGLKWSPYGTGLRTSSPPSDLKLAVFPNNTMVVACPSMYLAGSTGVNNVATWTGSQWNALGNPQYSIWSLGVRPSGTLVAGTSGASAPGMMTWSGTSWSSFGKVEGGSPFAIASLSNSDMVVGGGFTSIGGDRSQVVFGRWTDNPIPSIAIQPLGQTITSPATLTVAAAPSTGYSTVSFEWYREVLPGVFETVVNGPAGASPNGGTVSGASGQLPSPTDGTPATLTISNIQPSDAGMYRVTFWNSCGEATSIPVEVKVKAHITDINADGQVDDADFLLLLNQYDLMLCADPLMPDSCSADFNQDGFVDDADFSIFVPAYNALLLK